MRDPLRASLLSLLLVASACGGGGGEPSAEPASADPASAAPAAAPTEEASRERAPAGGATDGQEVPAVQRVRITVGDLAAQTRFFQEVLTFEPVGHAGTDARRLALGEEQVELVARSGGRPYPDGFDSNDQLFEHLAIVVSDMDAAHGRLVEAGVEAISEGGPQTIPRSNPAAGGIRAFYFRDPEGHPLELIWYPAGKGDPRWQSTERLFLGIDHTAIAVARPERAGRFYEELLGLEIAGSSLNQGEEQEALSGVDGARVAITGLRGEDGMGVEFLHYLAPGPGDPTPANPSVNDLFHWEIVVLTDRVASIVEQAPAYDAVVVDADAPAGPLLRDPEGHHVRLLAAGAAR